MQRGTARVLTGVRVCVAGPDRARARARASRGEQVYSSGAQSCSSSSRESPPCCASTSLPRLLFAVFADCIKPRHYCVHTGRSPLSQIDRQFPIYHASFSSLISSLPAGSLTPRASPSHLPHSLPLLTSLDLQQSLHSNDDPHLSPLTVSAYQPNQT